MSTHSITHPPISVATAGLAALAVLAVGTVLVAQNDDSSTSNHHSTTVDTVRKHPGKLVILHGGTTELGLP
jgi:hypothetical protein